MTRTRYYAGVAVVYFAAVVVVAARRPTLVDVQIILFLGGVGVWCVVLAFRST